MLWIDAGRKKSIPLQVGDLAPIRLTNLGYPGTTGLPAIGYRIVDAVTDAPGEHSYSSEELVRLDPPFCCYAPPLPLPLAEAPPCERQGFVTFGSLHKLEKLNDDVLDLWCSPSYCGIEASLLPTGYSQASASSRPRDRRFSLNR